MCIVTDNSSILSQQLCPRLNPLLLLQVKEPDIYETEHTCIGISLKAILLYEKSTDVNMMRGSPKRIPWNKIMNLSYKNKTFILDVSFIKKNKTQRRYNFVTGKTKISDYPD